MSWLILLGLTFLVLIVTLSFIPFKGYPEDKLIQREFDIILGRIKEYKIKKAGKRKRNKQKI